MFTLILFSKAVKDAVEAELAKRFGERKTETKAKVAPKTKDAAVKVNEADLDPNVQLNFPCSNL